MQKQRLLDAVVDHLAAGGRNDITLRRLAAAVGTSHRMLIYHFGSKEQLLVDVVREVEARQKAALADLADCPPEELGRRFWARLTASELRPLERLFFELYGQAVQGRLGETGLLDGIVDSWLPPLEELGLRQGMSPERARAAARLGLAVARGLLLDLVATDDEKAVDEAMELFLELYATPR